MAARGVEARKLARERMVNQLEAQRKRDADNQDDLAAFLEQDAVIERATGARDAAVAKAHEAYRTATAAAVAVQGEALARMKDRGLSERDLAELTGLPVGQLRKLTKTTEPQESSKPATRKTATTNTTNGGAITEPKPTENVAELAS